MKKYAISNNDSKTNLDNSTIYIEESEKILDSLASFKQAIHAVHSGIQSPIGMVFGSALSMAACCTQGVFDVACPGSGSSPTSLFILTIAESGERKTSTDAKFMRIVSEFEQEKNEGICLEPAAYMAEYDMWKSQLKVYKKLSDKAVTEGDEASVLTHKAKLRAHYENEPRTTPALRIIFEDTTMSALLESLANTSPNAVLNSSEGGILFERANLGFLLRANKIWDGGNFFVDRSSKPSYAVRNARLTISAMIQKKTLEHALKRKESGARSSGFFARFLITEPDSTQGTRFGNFSPTQESQKTKNQEYIDWLRNRALELLHESLGADGKPRKLVHFSPAAAKVWKNFYNEVESALPQNGVLSDIKDFASKISNNMSRIAAVLHCFCGLEGDISAETAQFSAELCKIYIAEFKKLFGFKDPIAIAHSNAEKVYEFLCKNNKKWNYYGFPKTWLLRHGPYGCRSKIELDAALGILANKNLVRVERQQGVHSSCTVFLNTTGSNGQISMSKASPPPEDVWNSLLQSKTPNISLIQLRV
ncbi:MAG: DUF3987 domain-containing protein [Burkholderiaceae bacterium]|jgi:hypothetical protein|nr:DUF3987 domain-containing protein [Burkholderiaceae bacterium]